MRVEYFDLLPSSPFFGLTISTNGVVLANSVPEVLFSGSFFWMGDDFQVPTITRDTPTEVFGQVDAGDDVPYQTRFFGRDLSVDANGTLTGGTISSIRILAGDHVVANITDISWSAAQLAAAMEERNTLTSTSGIDQLIHADALTVDASLSNWLVNISHFGRDTPAHLTGSQGSDQIIGGEGNDTLRGFDGDDSIRGEGGDDLLLGGAGNDRIFMGINDGADTIDGGSGDADYVWYIHSGDGVIVDLRDSSRNGGFAEGDVITNIENVVGTFGHDQIDGDSNNNFLQALGGRDTLHGHNGNDTLVGDEAWDGSEYYGGNGNDVFYVNRASGITFDGGAGWDTADFSQSLSGGPEEQGFAVDLQTPLTQAGLIVENARFVSIEGVIGAAFDDLIRGDGAGNHLQGLAGADTLEGRAGNDTLLGGEGQDHLSGGAGFDRLFGGAGRDVLAGGAQADNLMGEDGNDLLRGDAGFDRLFGGNGADVALGGSENDALFGQNGDDRLFGQWGDDRLFGGFNNDLLAGGTGHDSLFGGAGFDTLNGEIGDDVLSGNFNADLFVFSDFGPGFGQDTITDFAATNPFERIDLSDVASIVNLFDLFSNHLQQDGADVVIDAGGGNSIRLLDVALSDLDRSDFVF